MKGGKVYANAELMHQDSLARSATLRTEAGLKRYDSEEYSFEALQEAGGKLPAISPKATLSTYIPLGLSESRETLLSQIRNINKTQGRDLSACLRPLPVHSSKAAFSQRKAKRDRNGFKRVEAVDSKPRLRYLQTARSDGRLPSSLDNLLMTDGSKQRSGDTVRFRALSPSQKSFAELKEELKARRTTMSERESLKNTLDSRVNAVRSRMESQLGKELESLNRNGIFSPLVNEVRAATQISVKLEKHVKVSVREVMHQGKERMLEERKLAPIQKREPVVLSEEDLKKQELERRKLLLDHLEEKLVDKIARAERKAKDADDKKGIMRLTSEQIEAKLAKMKLESNKRQKPLMALKNLPVLDIKQGSRRIPTHVQ